MSGKEKLHDVYLGLGTNLGDKSANIHQAIKYIEERVGNVIAYSAFFSTEPVGFTSENQFLNAACHVQSKYEPLEFLKLTQQIELEMGRKEKSVNKAYADRIIDIDMLMYDSLILQSEVLVLPHPHMHDREFVMLPLFEIAANIWHPVLEKTIGELKSNLD